MKKNIAISLIIVAAMFILVFLRIGRHPPENIIATPKSNPGLFSNAANEIFISSIVRDADLNSGITLDATKSVIPEQINNIAFAVLNHSDESVNFPNQGFGLTVFRYNETAMKWENLQLKYKPYHEPKTLPPKLEKWDFSINNTWSVLEDETSAWGYKQIRLYVSGVGQSSGKTYGAYLDVIIHVP